LPEEKLKKKKLKDLEIAERNKIYEDTVTDEYYDEDYYSEDDATLSADERKRNEAYIKNARFKKLFYFSAGTIAVCFIILFYLLVSLLNKAKTDNADAPSALYSDEEVQNVINENEVLRLENEDLKNQILELTAESRADYERPAPQASEPVSPVTELPKKYRVQTGDTLIDISIKFYGNQKDYVKIKEANKIDGETIFAGQELIIP
jgi:LysM repeat protein